MMKDIFREALPVLENIAPLVAKFIGGYPAIAAEYLLPVLTNVAGIHSGDVGQLVRDIINKNETQNKIKRFEDDHSDLLNSLLENVNKLSSAEINVKLNFNKDN